MNKPRRIKEPEARATYIAMGSQRSLRALREKLVQEYGTGAPSLAAITLWSAKNKWQEAVKEYDRRVSDEIAFRAVKADARATFDAIKALTEAAEIALEAATLRNAAVEAAAKGDVRGMIAAGVEALKLKEVLNGGVSDRTGTVSEREREVEDQLAVLERALRSSRAKSPNVVGSGTA